jgi:tetratricopeptide (TPR) repeat protein
MTSSRLSKASSRNLAATNLSQIQVASIGRNVTSSSLRSATSILLVFLLMILPSVPLAFPPQSEATTNDLLAQAKAAELVRDFPRAAERYVTYLKDHSESADIWQRLGLVYYLDNRYEQAATALQRAVQLNPSLWGANLFLGISEYRTRRYEHAEQSLQAALKVNPDLPEGHLWLGSTLMARGEREAATAELQKVPAASSVAMDADYLLVQGYRRVAEDYYQQIQQNDANSYRAHQLAAESFAWTDEYQNAILEYRKALQLKPGLEGAHRGIAEMYWRQRQFEKAVREYEVELQKFPLDDEAHLRIGEYLLSQGNAGEAVPHLETAFQVNKKSWELDRAVGQAAMANGDTAKAQTWLESATQQNPSDALSHRLLAEVYRATGHADWAEREQAIFTKLSAAERN